MLAADQTDSERALRALATLAAMSDQRGRPVDLLPDLLADVQESTGADGLGFARREGDELVMVAAVGSLGTMIGSRSRVDASLGGAALLSRNVAVASDAMNDPRTDRALASSGEIGSAVAAPVDVSGTPAAVLLASWRNPRPLPDVALATLRVAAAVLAAAIGRTVHADRGDDPTRLVAAAFSQASHREAEQRRHHELDVLTGLLKAAPFEAALGTSAAHWSPSQNSAVLFIDLDRFHRINEDHGNAAGDSVLQRVANVLRRCTRGHDVVARLGGDDFAVLLNRLSNPELQAAAAAERIIDAVFADNLTNDASPRIELCIGAALIDRAGLSAERVMRDAEHALHAEKAGKR